jgi:hypothetical protein
MNIIAKLFSGRPGPNKALEITVSIEWYREPGFFIGLNGQVIFADRVVADSVQFQKTYWSHSTDSMFITREGNNNYQGKLLIPMRGEAIHYIEEHRRDQDIFLNVNLHYSWQEAIQVPTNEKGQTQLFGGQVHSDTVSVQDCVIKRSDWLKRLAEMGWQEYEIFEVARQPLLKDPNLTVALQRLVEAQTALRSGDYPGVLAKCRAAFESAAKHESQGDTKKGIESLLARAFPDAPAKQTSADEIIKALSEYAHLGRHEQYPAICIGHLEAEFCFNATVSVFSLLSRLLANKS